jgi:hypothetical protein
LPLLQESDYRLETRRSAYVDADPAPGDPRPLNVVHLASGSVENVDLVLSRGGAVVGTVVDSAGEPLQGVRVNALQVHRENGQLVASHAGWERLTDDRGRFRVFGLPSGSYLLVASTDAVASGGDRDQRRGFAQVYYPGSASIVNAQPVEVIAGRDLIGIDVSFAPSTTARVTGVAVNSLGEPIVGRIQLVTNRRSGVVTTDAMTTRVDPEGGFELRDVPPGDYVLKAIVESGIGGQAEFAAEFISVGDRDPARIAVRTSPGTTLEGRFIVEGMPNPPMRALSLRAASVDIDRAPETTRGSSGLAVFDDGRFYLTGLFGPMRFTLPTLPAGWYLKSMTIGGVDATDTPFDFGSGGHTIGDAEIVMSRSGATIAGVVNDGPRAGSFVAVAFPTAREWWFSGSRHLQQRRGSANGSFDIDGLPPGDYWVVAVDRLGDWESPEALDALVPLATRVTVAEGQVVSTELRLRRRQ